TQPPRLSAPSRIASTLTTFQGWSVAAPRRHEKEHEMTTMFGEAEQLVALAMKLWELGRDHEGSPVVIPRSGPRVVERVRGRDSEFRGRLSLAYLTGFRTVPGRGPLVRAI